VNGFDLNVPTWSSDMGMSTYLHRSEHDIVGTSIDHEKFIKCQPPISFMDLIGKFVPWEIYTVPTGCLLAHGSVIGKHLYALYTWNSTRVGNSMVHIRNQIN
jgi:hypothetical protein